MGGHAFISGRHPGEGRELDQPSFWVPAFAGMTVLGLVLAGCAGKPSAPAAPPAPVAAPKQAPIVAKPAPQKPTWTARKVVPDAKEVPDGTVTVASGDSLSAIAARAGVSVGALAVENGLAPPYTLRVGQILKIPGGRYHKVKPGETGIAIALAYGVKWNRVVEANRLEPPYSLAVGQLVRLPTQQAVKAMTLEERAQAFRLNIDDLITGSEPAAAPTTAPKPAASRPAQSAASTPKPVAEPAAFAGRFVWPLEGRILSGFGPKPGGRYNDGINIKTTTGTAVKAAADGVVAYAGDGIEGFGGLVLLKHGDGWVTAYAHNEELLVARGQNVKRGDTIARAGATGSVDEPQLHFEIRRGRTPVDPIKLLPAR